MCIRDRYGEQLRMHFRCITPTDRMEEMPLLPTRSVISSTEGFIKKMCIRDSSYTPMPETEVYPLHLPLGISQGCPVISDEVMRKVDRLQMCIRDRLYS